jgi:hypothetical protein
VERAREKFVKPAPAAISRRFSHSVCFSRPMLWLATTTLERLQTVPPRFWVNAALVVGGVLGVILLVRYAARMNKFILALIVFLMVTVVGFQWVFERNEPKFMTSTIDKIAPYFPSKIQYNEYQGPK